MNDREPSQEKRKPGGLLNVDDFRSVVRNAPLVSIDFIVRKADGRILVGRRTNEPAKGFLFVPGGRIRKNESLREAFLRLCGKELGIQSSIDDARFIGVFEHFHETDVFEENGSGTHYVVLAYELTLPALDLPPNDQHSEFLWLTDDEIRHHDAVHRNTKTYAGTSVAAHPDTQRPDR